MPTDHAKDDYLENGQPIHRLSYCAFLDVLGFSARIRASYKDKTANALLRQFHAIFKRRVSQLESDVDGSLLYFKSFSDNVLLAHPRFSHDMEAEFGFILWSISEYQLEMALQGFFIRGGLSVGNLFVDDNSVYGEALIDAHDLESKVAVNPIVVLCNNTMKLVDQTLSTTALGRLLKFVMSLLMQMADISSTTSLNVFWTLMRERNFTQVRYGSTKNKSSMHFHFMPGSPMFFPSSRGSLPIITISVSPSPHAPAIPTC
jgi:hypothetical protein